jgi:hypothetical protein
MEIPEVLLQHDHSEWTIHVKIISAISGDIMISFEMIVHRGDYFTTSDVVRSADAYCISNELKYHYFYHGLYNCPGNWEDRNEWRFFLIGSTSNLTSSDNMLPHVKEDSEGRLCLTLNAVKINTVIRKGEPIRIKITSPDGSVLEHYVIHVNDMFKYDLTLNTVLFPSNFADDDMSKWIFTCNDSSARCYPWDRVNHNVLTNEEGVKFITIVANRTNWYNFYNKVVTNEE